MYNLNDKVTLLKGNQRVQIRAVTQTLPHYFSEVPIIIYKVVELNSNDEYDRYSNLFTVRHEEIA